MDFSDYVFRCHMVGKIIDIPKTLTPNQQETLKGLREKETLTIKQHETLISLENKLIESKTYKLSDSTKKELNRIVQYEKSGRSKILYAKYLDKGLAKEKEARDLISEVLGINLIKDPERKTNKWVTGERDVFHDDILFEIKNAWSFESFSNILLEKANELYLRQNDSYMDLWEIKEGLICHVLVNTPNSLVDDEIRRLSYREDILNIEGDVRDDAIPEVKNLICNQIYTRKGLEEYCDWSAIVHIEWFDDFVEIPVKERIHMIPNTYDKIRIEQRNECIKLARKYMNTVKPINNLIAI